MDAVDRLGVIVLAAGAGQRLGRDKARLAWGATTLLGHVLEQFGGAEVARRVVVLSPANEMAASRGLPAGVEVAINREAGADMVASVRVGVAALQGFGGPLCIHPVDVFAVSRELVTLLYEGWRVRPGCLHLPEVEGGGGHPLIVPPRLVGEIERIPPGRGLNWLLSAHAGALMRHRWSDERLLADIDTLESYERYRPRGEPGGGESSEREM
jgi:CTP:molybdopterin cytidylyltransferase MocA